MERGRVDGGRMERGRVGGIEREDRWWEDGERKSFRERTKGKGKVD